MIHANINSWSRIKTVHTMQKNDNKTGEKDQVSNILYSVIIENDCARFFKDLFHIIHLEIIP